jgi:hypothetical protein
MSAPIVILQQRCGFRAIPGGCSSPGVNETIPPNDVNRVSPTLHAAGEDGHPVGTGSDLDVAIGSRFGSAVARLRIRSRPRWNIFEQRTTRDSANGTGFMVGPRRPAPARPALGGRGAGGHRRRAETPV